MDKSCVNCGFQLNGYEHFCPKCGNRTDQPSTMQLHNSDIEGDKRPVSENNSCVENRKSLTWKIAVLSVVVIALIALVIVLYNHSYSSVIYKFDSITVSLEDKEIGALGDFLGKTILESMLDGSFIEVKSNGSVSIYTPSAGWQENGNLNDILDGEDDSIEYIVDKNILYINIDGSTIIFRRATKEEASLYNMYKRKGPSTSEAKIKMDNGYGAMKDLSEDLLDANRTAVDANGLQESQAATEQYKYQERWEPAAVKDYKTDITFEQIARYPEDYATQLVRFDGVVTQVISETNDEVDAVFAVDGDYSKEIIIAFYPDSVSFRVMEGDDLTIYGMFLGLTSTTTVLGNRETFPMVFAEIIDQ